MFSSPQSPFMFARIVSAGARVKAARVDERGHAVRVEKAAVGPDIVEAAMADLQDQGAARSSGRRSRR